MKKISILLFLLLSTTVFSQFSKVHYIPPVSHSDSQAPQDQYIYISCPSITPVNFKIKVSIGAIIAQGTVSRDSPYVYRIGGGDNTAMLIDRLDVNKVMINKGFIIEAEDLVYVTARMTSTFENYQAGSIVSKGRAALGRQFRIGAFENIFAPNTNDNHYTFATIFATENNTIISFGSIKPGVTLVNNAAAGNTPANITLNEGESFAIAVEGTSVANKNGLIGASITASKDIVVNCGSFAGSNSATNNLDLGMDQIVSAERTGTKYIFIKGNGIDATERPQIIADQNGTEVRLNGGSAPVITLAAGEYKSFSGADFSAAGNMFIETSKPVFAYQGIGGTNNPANQNMHFVPPLSCGTPKIINNVPLINSIGNLTNFSGTVCVVAEAGATLSFIINGITYNSIAVLPSSVVVTGPLAVTGNTQYVTYTFSGLTGNISLISTSQVYLSYYASSGAATYGGFYSGFTFEPEITLSNIVVGAQSGCIPNLKLEVNALSSFDNFQWFQNQLLISGATDSFYQPTVPGYYFVTGRIGACGVTQTPYNSTEVPVSVCPPDTDNDGVNNNIDLDYDNDGITNCDESYGNSGLNLVTNAPNCTINVQNYTNNFTRTITDFPIVGSAYFSNATTNGDFISTIPKSKLSEQTLKLTFANPINIGVQYVNVAPITDLMTADAEFIIKVDINKTITVLNPTNQLLIDTDYDGIYESGVTKFSSFDIRFRLKSNIPLAAGTGTFKFLASQISTISIVHKNLSTTNSNSVTLNIFASCVPRDSDSDGIPDQLDLDSDNDGITDLAENLGIYFATNFTAPFVDANNDGLSDFFALNVVASDFDFDGVRDYLDLDSDNDGIYDLIESGSTAIDANNNGIIDGNIASFGTNGLSNSLQTVANSGIMNYTIADTDSQGLSNFVSKDSDGDGCFDVVEAGLSDPNNDGFFGNIPVIVNANGLVSSAIPYVLPVDNNYITAAPIIITTQPIDATECNLQKATFKIVTNLVTAYKWQVSTDNGLTYSNINNIAPYSGADTDTLLITSIPTTFNNYKYRVELIKTGNTCGKLSTEALLKVNPLPALTTPIVIIQCDNDYDGISNFNLNANNTKMSLTAATDTFTFFRTQLGAETDSTDPLIKITNPTIFNSGTATVWVRVKNANGCISIGQINITVSVPPASLAGFSRPFTVCDDLTSTSSDIDGVAEFNFSTVEANIKALLTNPNDFTIKFYKNSQDALQEFDAAGNTLAIPNASTSAYRNIGYPNQQKIWVRVENATNNDCFGFGDYITLKVIKLPNIKLTDSYEVCFNLPNTKAKLTAGFISGSTGNTYTYIWTQNGTTIANTQEFFETTTPGTYTVKVTNSNGCFRTRTMTVTSTETAVLLPPTIVEFSENDSVTINVANAGTFAYSIDNINGPFQSSPVFQNVSSGTHDFYVTSFNDCGIVKQTVVVLEAPKFFTPNNDGTNDFWNIKGITRPEYKKALIYIFDRYGKLITQIVPNSQGWDGKFNNEDLLADDYWFTVQLQDGRNGKGHFSLLR